MATDWIKIELTTPDKPEIVRMATLLKIDQDAVVGKVFRIWAWADQNSVNGANMAVTDAFIDRLTNKRGFATALREVGWLIGTDGGLTFPNFTRHNGSTAKGRAMENRKKNAQRERHKHPADCPDDDGTKPGTGQGTKTGTRDRDRDRDRDISDLAPAPAVAPERPPAPALVLLPSPAPKPPSDRPRNATLDALARATGSDPLQVPPNAWPGIAKALADIRAVCPSVTPSEIERRAANYRGHMRGATLTPPALAKHWALCDTAPNQPEETRGRATFA
jgi:hypothetical protein